VIYFQPLEGHTLLVLYTGGTHVFIITCVFPGYELTLSVSHDDKDFTSNGACYTGGYGISTASS